MAKSKSTSATQRYRAVLLSFFRYLVDDCGVKLSAAFETIIDGVNPVEPTAAELPWLKALDARLIAELGGDGADDDDEKEGNTSDE